MHSVQTRKKILKELETHTFREVSERFKISTRILQNWKKQLEPKRTRPRKATKITDEALRADIEKYPDAYQWERASRLNCSQSGIFKALKRLNYTVKKKRTKSTS